MFGSIFLLLPYLFEARVTEIFHSLVDAQGSTRLKLGGRNSIWVSHVGGKDATTGLVLCCLPARVLAGSCNQEQGYDWSTSTPTWDSEIPTDIFSTVACSTTNTCLDVIVYNVHYSPGSQSVPNLKIHSVPWKVTLY